MLVGVAIGDSPNGCVSCHTGDRAIGSLLEEAGHVDIAGKVNNVPGDCKSCHDGDVMDGIGNVAHWTHFDKGSANEFVSKHGGECTHCHKMDTQSGEVSVKSGAKNW